ncbi:MAG TPA: type II toxin-antitoxin system RelE/ParE family toxin [Anaerolineales bacterium]|nr:type II toxin-antitoxin system RelE/ParE family toxin [Anaerolineales bacterium]HNQ94252.1 type II toxin-antitoxin system RelE/ParE family toxin [Anaerolineales bacterium]HNS60614.1 type II toxin-antitoxin system RelE/ParE family toxin [Anaerolineales bacterium]
MADSPKPVVQVFFTPEFKRNVRALAKKYHHIQSDVQPFIEKIQRGELIGDKVQGTGYTIFKVRIRNSDVKRGKSGGYRVIYYLKTATAVVLVTIYSKTEQSDISSAKIKKILSEFG